MEAGPRRSTARQWRIQEDRAPISPWHAIEPLWSIPNNLIRLPERLTMSNFAFIIPSWSAKTTNIVI